ncbi:MAG: pilus assembly PilX N-terminal domain-containing protein, partial [Candidatus Eremiobacterota bacterium]
MRRRGFLIVVAVMLAPVCFLAVMTLIGTVVYDGRFAQATRTDMELFYAAEGGLALCHNAWARSNFEAVTIDPAGNPITADPNPMNIDPTLASYVQSTGTYLCSGSFRPGSNAPPPSPIKVGFRVQLLPPGPSGGPRTYKMVCEARTGSRQVTHVAEGVVEPAFTYVSFADGDDDFDGAANATLDGKVHANGELSLRPKGGSTLTFNAATVTATGKILRANGDPTSRVFINSTEMIGGTVGTAFDSDHPRW